MQQRWVVLLALVLGITAGTLIDLSDTPMLHQLVGVVEPIGTLWINALRMVVIPLVVSLLIVGVASVRDVGEVGRLGGTALAVWISLLVVSGILGVTVVPLLFSGLSVDPTAVAALRENAASLSEGTTAGLERMPSIGEWLTGLIPTNPFRAAADGAMLPLVIFSLAFGLAITRVEDAKRRALVDLFGGAADAMLVLVRWVLLLTPVGVFALSLAAASRVGAMAAGVLGYYIAITAVSMLGLSVLLFALTCVFGRVSPRALAQALVPAQVVGFSSRSSLSTLPAQAEAATDVLKINPSVVGFVLPLAVSSFKPHGPLNWCGLATVAALLYGVPLGPTAMITVAVSALLLSFAVPGIPSAGMLLIAPVFTELGIPVEAIGLLIAVDSLPDMFKTVANVTGQFCSTVIVARYRGGTSGDTRSIASSRVSPAAGSA